MKTENSVFTLLAMVSLFVVTEINTSQSWREMHEQSQREYEQQLKDREQQMRLAQQAERLRLLESKNSQDPAMRLKQVSAQVALDSAQKAKK